MTIHTQPVSLTPQYQQLTDGVSSFFLQVKSGVMEYVLATSLPSEDTEGYTKGVGPEIIVTPPTQIWGRSAVNPSVVKPCRIVISPVESE